MKNLLGTLEAKISAKGGRCAVQVEYTAIMPEGDYAHYIVHPYQLGADNIVVTAKGADIDVSAVVSMLETHQDSEDIESITLWLTDNVSTDLISAMDYRFVA